MEKRKKKGMRAYKKPRRSLARFIGRCFLVLFVFLLYILIGGIVPFIYQKQVSKEYKEAYTKADYYKEGVSVDRAFIVETSSDALDIRLDMINSAKERILFTTFSMKPDEACTEICAALYAAAERGVKVELLIDGLSGSWDMKYDPMFYALGTHENVEMKYYNFFYVYAPWTFNGRLHDKFIVVDDNQLILGGRNTSNYFLGSYDQKVLSYDREVYVYNTSDSIDESVFLQVEDYFYSLWKSDASKAAYNEVPAFREKKVEKARKEYLTMVESMQKEEPKLWDQKMDYTSKTIEVNHISLVHNPINTMSKEPKVWYTLEQLMKDAKEQVLIQSPYVVLNKKMYQGLTEIGKDLKEYELLINSIAVGDNICASSDYKNSKKDVLDTGIDVYEFQGKHSMHNKSLVIDHRLSIVGSFNFDMRSAYLDTETMLVIDGKEFATELEKNIKSMQKESILVKEDGTYAEKSKVEAKEPSDWKKFLYSFLPYVLRPIRFLL